MKTIVDYFLINKLVLKGAPLTELNIIKLKEDQAKRLHLKKTPQLIISEDIASPFVFGCISAKIIIPKYLIQNFEADSFKSIILHELAHIKRKDLIKGWVQILSQNILWFNPFIYIYNKTMNHSREEVCDNYSLSHHKPNCYAKILTKLAASNLKQNHFLGANPMLSSKNELFF